jgi:hypothetical protein
MSKYPTFFQFTVDLLLLCLFAVWAMVPVVALGLLTFLAWEVFTH